MQLKFKYFDDTIRNTFKKLILVGFFSYHICNTHHPFVSLSISNNTLTLKQEACFIHLFIPIYYLLT